MQTVPPLPELKHVDKDHRSLAGFISLPGRLAAVRAEFLILFALALLANICFIANFSLTIDDEQAALRTDPAIWVGEGRFMVYLIERFLFPQPALPYSPYIFLALCQAFAYMLLVRSHGLRTSWRTYVGFLVLITFPTWWAISEFAANAPSFGLGFLCVALALYRLYNWPRDRTPVARVALAIQVSLLLTVALGTYQAYFVVFATMVFGVVLIKDLPSCPGRQASRRVAMRCTSEALAYLLAATAIYYLISKISRGLLDAHSDYIANFIRTETILSAPLWFVGQIARYALAIYTGSASIFGNAMPIIALLIASAAIAIIWSGAGSRLLRGLLLAIVLGLPFLLNLMTGWMELPVRSLPALSYVVWLMTTVLLHACTRWWLLCTGMLIGIYQLQMASTWSRYMVSATVTQHFDRMIAEDIGRQLMLISHTPDAPLLIDVYGYRSWTAPAIFGAETTGIFSLSFFGWSESNLKRVSAYMNVLGYRQIRAIAPERRRSMNAEFATMPKWPRPGSIKRFQDVVLVKIADKPDLAHRP